MLVIAASSIHLESDGQMKHRHQEEKRMVTWLLGSYSLTLKRLSSGDTTEDMKVVKVEAHDYELESKLSPFFTFRKLLKCQRWK